VTGVLFFNTLRGNWLQIVYWGAGLGLMALVTAAMVPFFDSMKMVELIQGLPPILLAAAGYDADLQILATPEGLITIGFFGEMMLIFVACPIVLGMRISANDEDNGIMEVILSLPLPRWQVIVERFLAFCLILVGVSALVYAGLWLGVALAGVQLDMARMATVVFNVVPVLIFVLAFTALMATLFRRRQRALAVTVVFVVASFMLDVLAGVTDGGLSQSMHAISFFSYYDPAGILQHGLDQGKTFLTGALALLLALGSLWAFQRRDVGLWIMPTRHLEEQIL